MKKIIISILLISIGYWFINIFNIDKKTTVSKLQESMNLADKYYRGDGVKKDYEKALFLLKKEPLHNSSEAKTFMGIIYTEQKEYQKAINIFEQAINQGSSQAMHNLGNLYFQPFYPITKDYKKAIKLFKDACNLNNHGACLNFGYMTEHGLGTKKDINYALKIYTDLCKSNIYSACANIGLIYNFNSKFKNLNKAIEFYTKACNGNHGQSCNNLGKVYSNKNLHEEAFNAYINSCKNQYANGCFKLGNAYSTGEGTTKNLVKVKNAYHKSCKLGREDGCNRYYSLKNNNILEQTVALLCQRFLNGERGLNMLIYQGFHEKVLNSSGGGWVPTSPNNSSIERACNNL